MLRQEQPSLELYSDFYDRIIPKDNLLRQIKETVDFRFIYEELERKYCPTNGRNAESPVKLFKYLLLKCITNLYVVDVVEQSQYDMSFKYFLDLLISKSMEIAISKGLVKSKTVIIDATHTYARYNSKPIREVLLEQSKNLRKAVYQVDESMTEKMPVKNTENDIQKETAYCRKLIETIKKESGIAQRPDIKKKINYQ